MKDQILLVLESIRYIIDGKEVAEEVYRQRYPLPVPSVEGFEHCSAGAWPMLSDALAVHPKQIEEARARNRKHGLDVDYHPEDGRAILRDRDQRRRLMKLERCHDNNGGYGDG